jgi:hypothetical protein
MGLTISLNRVSFLPPPVRNNIFYKIETSSTVFYTHHRIPNKHMMTINFDTITNNYEVIYVIKTDEILFKKNRYVFYQPYYSYLFCCFVEIIKNTLVEPFFNCLYTFTMECGAYSNNAV